MCRDVENWEFQDPAFLAGLAIDGEGNTPYGNSLFLSRYEAQVACTELGDGCGGLTGFYKNGVPMFNLRRGTEFIVSTRGEFAYLKPKNQCQTPTWSNWSEMSACTETCGDGQTVRTRNCLTVAGCIGADSEIGECNDGDCRKYTT